jgi:hypothetical protein
MADNRNILIVLLVVIVILLVFLVLKQVTYTPVYSPGYYQPWQMGPGMMYGYGPSNSTSIADELSKLNALKKNGAITLDEYNKLKNSLMD